VSPLSPRVEALDVFVGLLSEIDEPTPADEFYNRLCEAVARLTSMERVVLFLYDDALRRVRAAGARGIDPSRLADIPTLAEAPVAQRALAEDRVIEISSESLEDQLPAPYARPFGITTLTCTPVSAAGRWFGVLVADRGGGEFKLTSTERHALWTLGKMAALAASARIVTRQEDRARRLGDRIALAREIHEQVIQRLFGVSLALGSGQELSGEERVRCQEELNKALADLRTALRRPLAADARRTSTTLRQELDHLGRRYRELPLAVAWSAGVEVPDELEPLAQSLLWEAFRNIHKHAHPGRIDVAVGASEGAFVLEVRNDGVRADSRGTGMGLRLAAFEALQQGGVVEWGAVDTDGWRVRLVVPLAGP